jgi:hypothetical protein
VGPEHLPFTSDLREIGASERDDQVYGLVMHNRSRELTVSARVDEKGIVSTIVPMQCCQRFREKVYVGRL